MIGRHIFEEGLSREMLTTGILGLLKEGLKALVQAIPDNAILKHMYVEVKIDF